MVTKFRIQNYKSILDDTIELGKVNVLIGENGCGKSNILEAFAMFDAGMKEEVEPDDLYNRGVRVVLPRLTLPQFNEQIEEKVILEQRRNTDIEGFRSYYLTFTPSVINNIPAKWEIENDLVNEIDNIYNEIELDSKKLDKAMSSSKRITQVIIDEVNQLTAKIEIEDEHEKKILLTESRVKLHAELDKILEERELLVDDFQKAIDKADSFVEIHTLLENISNFLIYDLNTKALRGIFNESKKKPVGINGEGLDILISSFNEEELAQLKKYNYLIGWLEDFFLDPKDICKFDGMKMGKSTSLLYFKDKFMVEKNNVFSAENANEDILHVLFYLSILISKRTPEFFGIDNIETALNPHLCRHLMKEMSELAIENEKQIVVTTHNPAILDGLDLTNDDIRLFEIYRGDKGDTKTRRIQFKKGVEKKYKLSEMWMKGMLGAISQNF